MHLGWKASAVFIENYYTGAHTIVNQGGTNSGKTYAILQVLFCLAAQRSNQVITITGQDIPHLKSGVLRDALGIYSGSVQLAKKIRAYNKSDRIFKFYNGTIIEFKSYADAQDAKSGKRDYLFVNEANGINWEIYSELALRTRKRIYIDYNPNSAFWVHDNLLGGPGVQLIISDHRHNPFIGQTVRDKIESLKEKDEKRWRVYARGMTGRVKGLVFDNWHICETIPTGARFIAAGLDFGFSNDETGCIEVYKQNGELWINELLYEKGLTNTDIAKKLTETGLRKSADIIADSAEPKSIEELRRLGWHISPARKGRDSVKNSIDILRRYKLNITRGSTNLRNELSRYKWKTEHSGRVINEPVDTCNHLIDPLRYIALNKLKISNLGRSKTILPSVSPSSAGNMIKDMLTT
ncbi:PBSX family phage terminase large subunit [Mucilaginibacter sp.]|jgi:phage terminase large subunit|uniref:PBSX family phage terminase large subunit n=1 Tax=Mucilaginibacter sp. TaxID=1882438 RepID=UPI002B9F2540|nr:terminase large subunit [Mucilaginibacter sp.]HTI58446.1 terminase large subunit [Mucilaginibacter sp.]